jgi:hypothetical protein
MALEDRDSRPCSRIPELFLRMAVLIQVRGVAAMSQAFDPSDRDGVGNAGRKEIVNRPVFGMYLPDGIASYTSHGDTYLVTANEGDARRLAGLQRGGTRAGSHTRGRRRRPARS